MYIQLVSGIKQWCVNLYRLCDYMLSINTKKFMLTYNLLDTMYHLSLLRNLFMLMLYYRNIGVCNERKLVLCKISMSAFLLVYNAITIMVLFLPCLWYFHSRPMHLWCYPYVAAKLCKHIWIVIISIFTHSLVRFEWLEFIS